MLSSSERNRNMKSRTLQWLAIILIVQTGLVHYFTAQHEFEEAAFLGYLFMANFLGALLAAWGIYRQQIWGWGLGFAIAAGSIAGYVWSRTLGLPGLESEAWLTPWGLLALAAEGLFILLLLLRPWRTIAAGDQQPQTPTWLRYILPAAGVTLLVLISGLTYRWDAAGDFGHEHIASVEELNNTPVTSLDQLEQQYGVQVFQAAISALDSIVDVRLKIIDPDKAQLLLDDHAALLVDQESLILAASMHHHNALKPGEVYFVFFPTLNDTVHSGSEVSLVFGDLRLEPVTVE